MMKQTRILLCWLLALSLAGLPFASSASTFSPTQRSDESCEHADAGMAGHDHSAMLVITSSQAKQAAKPCCADCEGNCLCKASVACHSSNAHQSVAIESSDSLRNLSINTAFSVSPAGRYHSRDIEPDIIPPIV